MRRSETLQLIWLPTGGHIGDGIMVSSLFAEIIRYTPDIRIMYVVRRNGPLLAELVRAYPQVTTIQVPNTPLAALEAIIPLFKKRSLVTMLPACDAHPIIIRALCILFRIRGDTVLGYRARFKGWHPYSILFTHDRGIRYIDSLRQALSLVSLPTEPVGSPPKLALKTSLPKDFPFTGKPYIVLHPFPHMATTKTMPLRRWKHLLQEFERLYPSYGLVITGADVDRPLAEELAQVATRKVFLAIQSPLLEVAGLIAGSSLYIGIDTGPTHIAGVLQTPSVVLAQQNEPAWLPSYNPNAVLLSEKKRCLCGIHGGEPCVVWEAGKSYRRCVYDITDEAILAAVHKKLAHTN